MNALFTSRSAGCCLLGLMTAVCLLLLLPGASTAADSAGQPTLAAASSSLFASWLQDVAGNRTRLIQASFIFIIIGIFILWKK